MDKQKILYGAGAMGRRAFEYYTKGNPDAVYCFADTYKGGTEYLAKPVISFEKFLVVHADYEVILCIFDLFQTAALFEKSEVNYVVWDDNITIPIEDKIADNYFSRLRQTEPLNPLPKIIYGAGQFGGYALNFYGKDNVYAFADRNKSGFSYLSKPVIAPDKLAEQENTHDIVVCVAQSNEVCASLNSMGVKRFRVWNACDDVRMMDANNMNGTLLDSKIIDEMKDLDFIVHPEYINNYHTLYIQYMRTCVSYKAQEKVVCSRSFLENKLYGFYNEIAKYAGRDVMYYDGPSVAHGVWLDDKIDFSLEVQNVMEAGQKMKFAVYGKNRDCLYFTCGPYLHYAEPFYNDAEFVKYKKRLGHNLLVFPIHSLPYTDVLFDYRSFVNFAISEAKCFDSINVCVHHNDFNSEMTQLFRAHGANIVSCGLLFDNSFVKRIKTIISASDAVLTNGLGSHIPYCLGMGRPIKYFPQQVEYFSTADPKASNIYSEATPLKTALPTSDYLITPELLDVYRDIYTFSQIKTKEEMGAIFDLSKRIMVGCGYKRSKYTQSLRETYRDLSQATSEEEKLQFRLMRDALPADYQS